MIPDGVQSLRIAAWIVVLGQLTMDRVANKVPPVSVGSQKLSGLQSRRPCY
jgi:hypothetical protein